MKRRRSEVEEFGRAATNLDFARAHYDFDVGGLGRAGFDGVGVGL